MALTTQEILKDITHAISEKKGEDIRVLDVSEITPLCDYFVITNGNNQPQVEAITDNIMSTLFAKGIEPKRVEGKKNSGWMLLDYVDIVVHIFMPEDRSFYNLEHIWKDAIVMDIVD